ncbi:unnamed protein product [Cyclocybe aegerita]|uniref:Reverse transcriptase domain-containing protein n=1 Tax=Cyclocybe aegerita TaxID=1973307 RepID=A0A8S0W4E6_CYCAE|nr:unnamed protein product [Cyclocybe aegerita]
MANRKSKSDGQSQGPKQAAGGRASRSPNPQATNKPRSVATAHPQMMGNASSKPPASSGTAAAPRPPQPQATAHRPSNGTKHQNAGNGAPKSQGANGSNFVRAEAMSGHRASQDRSVNQGTPKRNGSGLNNGPQKVQGHSSQPNISSKNEAPKPKHSQAFFGGHSSASNSALPSPPRPGNIQHLHVPKAHGATISGNKVFQDPSPTSKRSGHTQPHAQKAQNHAPTPPKEPTFFLASPAHQQQSGKNTASNTFPKVQVATTHAQHPSRGGQSSAPPAQGSEKPSHKSQQQHKAPPHSRLMQETSSKGHKDTPPKPSTNKGKPPTESVLSTVFSFFSTGSEAPGNPSHKSQHAQQGRAPPHSRLVQEIANKDHKNTPPRPPMNDRPQGQFPAESVLPTPKVSPSNHFAGSNGTGNRSVNFVIPPGSTHNSATVGSGSLHSRAAKKQGPNVAKGSANVPQAAAVKPQTWGQMISSWFLPSAPPVDVQAANKSTSSSMKAKDPGPKPQAPNSTKANDGQSKSHPAPDLSFIPREHWRKEPILSTKGAKNGLQDLPNRSNNSDTLSSATSPKKEQAPTHPNMLVRSDGGPQYSSSVSEKPEKATNLTSALSHAADHSRMSSKPQAAAVHHLKQFQVRSSSSKVLSQHDPKKIAAVRKGLLRQRTPTLRWRESNTPRTVSAYSTLTAAPLPSPPRNELQNKVARKTISQNPDLFKVVSPIKVDVFKEYVKDHPNQSFVQSVARALKKGFWPWADTSDPSFPTTYDGSRQGSRITSEDKAKFIRQQCEDEMELERWSKPFGSKLMPGMHSAPINAVPKSTPGKFRLIVDQSRGPHALNSTIPKSQVKVQLDNIHDLGNELLAARKKYPNRKLCLFKSDVKSAYRQLPMHPLWQIKQAILIDGQYHIDRCNTFGNRGGGWNWDSFNSSVNWIATEKKGVSGLLGYVDDIFGWEFERNKKVLQAVQ